MLLVYFLISYGLFPNFFWFISFFLLFCFLISFFYLFISFFLFPYFLMSFFSFLLFFLKLFVLAACLLISAVAHRLITHQQYPCIPLPNSFKGSSQEESADSISLCFERHNISQPVLGLEVVLCSILSRGALFLWVRMNSPQRSSVHVQRNILNRSMNLEKDDLRIRRVIEINYGLTE